MEWLAALSPLIIIAVLIALPERRDKHGFLPDASRRDWLLGLGAVLVAIFAFTGIGVLLT